MTEKNHRFDFSTVEGLSDKDRKRLEEVQDQNTAATEQAGKLSRDADLNKINRDITNFAKDLEKANSNKYRDKYDSMGPGENSYVPPNMDLCRPTEENIPNKNSDYNITEPKDSIINIEETKDFASGIVTDAIKDVGISTIKGAALSYLRKLRSK